MGDENDDIPAADMEVDGSTDWFGFDEDEQDDGDQEGAQQVRTAAPKPTLRRNLYPFAIPAAVDKRVLQDVCKASQRTHLIVFTRTAHPGVLIAGRELGLKFQALSEGVNTHSANHGEALLKIIPAPRKRTDARNLLEKAGTLVPGSTTCRSSRSRRRQSE